MTTRPGFLSFCARHKRGLIALGTVLAAVAGTGYKLISEARAEADKETVVVQIPAPDVVGLRQDIGYLRDDIRDERHARESLTKEMGEFNGRLSRLEAKADEPAKAKK